MRSSIPDLSALRAGSRTVLARLLTQVENADEALVPLLEQLAPWLGRAQVLGITGAPGAGKSTLINALLAELRRRGQRVAVLAIDPSSPVSGGALLGDRVRMGEHGEDEQVFIRSLASRGELGGLARAAERMVDVLDAAGFDVVIVETVGVGQSEVDIRHLADCRVVVCAPSLGDEVQAAKAGILEIADILVVNKADLPQAARTVHDLQASGVLRSVDGWTVELVPTVASAGQGVAALADLVERHARSAGVGRRRAAPAAAADAAGGGSRAAPPASDEALFAQVADWRAQGRGVALATVVRTWGSSPRPEGSHLAADERCEFIGSVSGGCIEAAVIDEAQRVIASGEPRLLEFGVSDEQAWEVGLACGGRIQVYVERIG
ncbi:methylmalonyl Co-A mutase-associated GTPase MeaB [Thauera aromatica]|nr:methylmalonyl Co-A mutase-associated GTPase MeaB [Thauera aromatica]MCK2126607.1 methylmalonyl Co-A mutase-associated GTPase MeaB [Thauera aromatica]